MISNKAKAYIFVLSPFNVYFVINIKIKIFCEHLSKQFICIINLSKKSLLNL